MNDLLSGIIVVKEGNLLITKEPLAIVLFPSLETAQWNCMDMAIVGSKGASFVPLKDILCFANKAEIAYMRVAMLSQTPASHIEAESWRELFDWYPLKGNP